MTRREFLIAAGFLATNVPIVARAAIQETRIKVAAIGLCWTSLAVVDALMSTVHGLIATGSSSRGLLQSHPPWPIFISKAGSAAFPIASCGRTWISPGWRATWREFITRMS